MSADLTPEHVALLEAAAIDVAVARAAGVRSVVCIDDLPALFRYLGTAGVPAIVFPWRSPDGGREVLQLRPDTPVAIDGEPRKYFWTADEPLVVWQHPLMDGIAVKRIVVVEGTKQYLAAISHAIDGDLIIGIAGCQGWRLHDELAHPDLALVDWVDVPVVIVFDADVRTNPNVWAAATALGDDLEVRGAASVRFAKLPGGGSTGLDDVLAAYPAGTFARLLDGATALPKTKPKGKRDAVPEMRYFDPEYGLMAQTAAEDLLGHWPMAINLEGAVCIYEEGAYWPDREVSVVTDLLGELYRPAHRNTLADVLRRRLRVAGRLLDDAEQGYVINLANGTLDLATLELRPHTPDLLTSVRLPVAWDPTATCPNYERWAAAQIGDQLADIEECSALALDPSVSPPWKAIFPFGPPRSGKSTWLRILGAMVGPELVSAVTLQRLATDQFAAAEIYGKLVNAAADLSSTEVSDLALFRMMTGDDAIHGNRKYGRQFTFRNKALFAFSANEPPTISETSGAYLERIKPFEFGTSFAGAEDPAIEAAMMAELPGILVRWVAAIRRWHARGGYAQTDAAVAVKFETKSYRVRQWVAERCVPIADEPALQWTAGPLLLSDFVAWATANNGGGMGRNTFYDHLRAAGHHSARNMKTDTAFPLRLRRPGEHPDDDGDGAHGGYGGFNPQDAREGDFSEGGPGQNSVCEGVMGGNPHNPHAAGTLVFDLETCDAEQLWHRPDFVRLAAHVNSDLTGPVAVGTDVTAIVDAARAGSVLVAHNGFAFDFVALAAHHGLDLLELGETGRLRDTAILAMLADPPEARMKTDSASWRYELSATSQRLGGPGKTDQLARLKRKHGGYDMIPTGDAEYRDYNVGDVEATVHIVRSLPGMDDYARREMRLLGRIVSSVSVVGFRVDEQLLAVRLADQEQRIAARIAWLTEGFGLPTTRKDGTPAKAPLATQAGKWAIVEAFKTLGLDVDGWPMGKTGAPLVGREIMAAVLEAYGDDADVVELAETVAQLNGEPAAYGSIVKYVVDGRVHPRVSAGQASGRLSIRKPGLTVLGKRSPALLAQRDVFIADEGCVLFAVDLAQIDARAVAALSGCPDYAQIFTPGRDLHTEVARRLWGDAVVDADPKCWRERAKPLSHGYPYGMGDEGLARHAGVSLDEAIAYRAFMESSFPRLHEWMAEVRDRARTGELLDNGFGRRMRVSRGREHTQAPALMGQGCARDLMMEGVLRLPVELVPMLRATVHDELVFSVPVERFEELRSVVVEALEFTWSPPDGSGRAVAIIAEATGPADRWGSIYAAPKATST